MLCVRKEANMAKDKTLNIDKSRVNMPRQRDAVNSLIWMFLHDAGLLVADTAEQLERHKADLQVCQVELVQYAVSEGIVAEEDVIPF